MQTKPACPSHPFTSDSCCPASRYFQKVVFMIASMPGLGTQLVYRREKTPGRMTLRFCWIEETFPCKKNRGSFLWFKQIPNVLRLCVFLNRVNSWALPVPDNAGGRKNPLSKCVRCRAATTTREWCLGSFRIGLLFAVGKHTSPRW